LIQKKANKGKQGNIDTFIAGLLGGYIVFGQRNAVNEQVRAITAKICKSATLLKTKHRWFFM